MKGLVRTLREFNAKERYWLAAHVFANVEAGLAGGLKLTDSFCEELRKFGYNTSPDEAFAAIDYHIDWIVGSLYRARHGTSMAPVPNADRLVWGQQEDIDLLIAFDEGETTHLILVEAKGATAWLNPQVRRKAARLKRIFESETGPRWLGVTPAFFVMSPSPPSRLQTDLWPRWMTGPDEKVRFLALRMPPYPEAFARVVRCDRTGKKTRLGDHFMVDGPSLVTEKGDSPFLKSSD